MRFAISDDGKRTLLAIAPNHVEIRETNTGKTVAKAPLEPKSKYTSPIVAVAISDDGKTAAICNDLGRVYVWNASGDLPLHTFFPRTVETGGKPAPCLAFSPDGKKLAITARGDFQLYDLDTLMEAIPSSEGHRGEVEHLAFSADAKQLLSSGALFSASSNELLTWDLETSKRLKKIPPVRKPRWPNLGQ